MRDSAELSLGLDVPMQLAEQAVDRETGKEFTARQAVTIAATVVLHQYRRACTTAGRTSLPKCCVGV